MKIQLSGSAKRFLFEKVGQIPSKDCMFICNAGELKKILKKGSKTQKTEYFNPQTQKMEEVEEFIFKKGTVDLSVDHLVIAKRAREESEKYAHDADVVQELIDVLGKE